MKELVACLQGQDEIRKIVVFGSFLTSQTPQDLDVAVFQDSGEDYLTLAMKYRRLTRPIARLLPLDILPIRMGTADGVWTQEIGEGEVVYER
jgi:predicted nucleotidyltransferase